MTYERMHSAQAQSVRATEKISFVTTFQEVWMNVDIFHP